MVLLMFDSGGEIFSSFMGFYDWLVESPRVGKRYGFARWLYLSCKKAVERIERTAPRLFRQCLRRETVTVWSPDT